MTDGGKPGVAGLVLAAGSSQRMGRPKALLDAGGRTFLARLVETLATGGCDPVWAVCAAPEDATALEALACGARLAVNPGGRGGPIASIQRGLAEIVLLDPEPGALVLTPVDNPRVQAATVTALIDAWRSARALVVVPVFAGEGGHPILLSRSVFGELASPDLPEGARSVVRRDPARVLRVPVSDPGILDDFDTPSEYSRHFSGGSS